MNFMQRRKLLQIESLERRDLLASDLLAGISGGSPQSSAPSTIIATENHVVFTASFPEWLQVWGSDGTPDGTVVLLERGSIRAELPFQGDVVYLSNGRLFRSGGTVETTIALTDDDIVTVGDDLVVFEGHIYFKGSDRNNERSPLVGGGSDNGVKLMRTDGTLEGVGYFHLPEGTRRRDRLDRILGIWNGNLHYTIRSRSGDDILRRTDGTPEGTEQIEGYDGKLGLIRPLAEFEGHVFGEGHRPFATGLEYDLTVTDGASLDTLYFDIYPGLEQRSLIHQVVATPAGVFFTAKDANGFELWRSDGNVSTEGPAPPDAIIVYSDAAFTQAVGFSASTYRVTDLPDFVQGTGPEWLTWHNNTLLFSFDFGLWKYTPNSGAVELVKNFGFDPIGFSPRWLTVVEDQVYFAADDGRGEELWITDGTAGGTRLVVDLQPGPAGSRPSGITAVNDDVFFAASTTEVGNELWKLNRLTGEVTLVKDVDPAVNPRFQFPRDLFLFNGVGFFRFDEGTHGTELWTTDGTPEGTSLFLDINPGKLPSGPRGFIVHQDELYFVANDGTHGYELWKTDGTPANTAMVRNIWAGSDGVLNHETLTPLGDRLYFSASDGVHGVELWMTDGTAEGTVMTADLNPGAAHTSFEAIGAGDGVVMLSHQNLNPRGGGIASGLYQWNGEEIELVATATELRLQPTGIHILGEEVYLDGARAGQLRLLDRESKTVEGVFDSYGSIYPLGTTEKVIIDRDGVHVVNALGEANLVDDPISNARAVTDAAVSIGDFVYYWRTGVIGGDAFVKRIELGERFPTTLLTAREIGAVRREGDALLVETVTADNNVFLWTLDESPLRTRAVSEKIRTPQSAITINGRLVYITKTGFGDSVFVADTPPQNALTGNHRVLADDVDAIFFEASSGGGRRRYDVNDDSVVDEQDINFLFSEVLNTDRADLNLDGKVGFADFLILSANFGQEDANWSDGDIDGNLKVDFGDFLALSAAFDT